MDKTLLFVQKAKKLHNNKYNYSKSKYINARTKVIIGCGKHGDFLQLPRKHLKGQQCPNCAIANCNNHRLLSTAEFVRRSIITHSDKYGYSKSVYVNSKTKISIICKKHGEFSQYPHAHTRGHGCRKCADYTEKYSDLDFPHGFFKLLGQTKYDYSKTVVTSINDLITITCNKHGDFKIAARSHLNGSGCKKCGYLNKHKITFEQWHQRAIEKYGNKFDFTETDFSSKIIEVICCKHGKMIKDRAAFTQGAGCYQCGLDQLSAQNSMGFDEFVRKSNSIHNNIYDYSDVVYKNQLSEINIICNKHGCFKQKPKHHLRGCGCPVLIINNINRL